MSYSIIYFFKIIIQLQIHSLLHARRRRRLHPEAPAVPSPARSRNLTERHLVENRAQSIDGERRHLSTVDTRDTVVRDPSPQPSYKISPETSSL